MRWRCLSAILTLSGDSLGVVAWILYSSPEMQMKELDGEPEEVYLCIGCIDGLCNVKYKITAVERTYNQ